MSDEKQAAKDELRRPETQKLLKQFLKVERGLGKSSAERLGWDFMHLDPEQQSEVLQLSEDLGMHWAEAFQLWQQMESEKETKGTSDGLRKE